MNKDTLLNALNDYLLHIQLDPIGDITSKINAVEACRNYVAAIDGDVVNADWVKSNCIIILPAIDYQRKGERFKFCVNRKTDIRYVISYRGQNLFFRVLSLFVL